MAAPTYSTDLLQITRADVATGETGERGTLTWAEPTGSTQGGTPAADADYFIVGTANIDKTFNATGIGGIGVTTQNAATIPTDGAVYIWHYFGAPNAINDKTNGGMQMLIGSSVANYYRFYVAGKDTYTYGGWLCFPIDPSVTASATYGAPTSTRQFFGIANNVTNSITKGSPCAIDAIRYGRGTLQVTGGDGTSGYGTFSGAATFNDYNDATNGYNRYGILQYQDGSYKFQGQFLMGTSGSVVDFRDSNKNIVVQNTEFVQSGFNLFEIRNASSRVDWIGISISSLCTVSKGNFLTTDNADVNFDSCTFTDMGTFVFMSSATVLSTTFRRCGQVTKGGGTFTGCKFENSPASASILTSSTTTITECTFVSDGSNHAIQIDTPGEYSLSDNIFTGYATSDGTSGNEVIYNTSGGQVTLNASGNSGVISCRNDGSSTTSIIASIDLDIELRDADGALITENCEITVVKASDESVLFHEDDITDGKVRYSYSVSGTVTYIAVMNVSGYQAKTINNYALPSTSATLTIQMDDDPFYHNP